MNYNNNFPSNDVLNFPFIHSNRNRIPERICRSFNEGYPHPLKITKKIFWKIKSNFLRNGNVEPKKTYHRPVINNEGNEIVVLGYFNANPNFSIPTASKDLESPGNKENRNPDFQFPSSPSNRFSSETEEGN
ncbi:hypothetical protein ABEB36_000741 [Hypothenemus hampei]|uniref:Uncharacterized protein n=1 Tax=Hypothenemus hampei TaxID=57062 RepID=A0ABD1FE70_HYPHA